MIILGVDPGYRNLGLSVVDTRRQKVLHSQNYAVGYSDRWRVMPGRVDDILDQIYEKYPFEAVAYEDPPMLNNKNTTAKLWFVMGAVLGWAAAHGLEARGCAPKIIKWVAQDILGEVRHPRAKVPKSTIKDAVELWTGAKSAASANHEDDATLAAIANWAGPFPRSFD